MRITLVPAAALVGLTTILSSGFSVEARADRGRGASTYGGLVAVRAQLHEAYTDMPLVQEVRNSSALTIVQRERVLDTHLPADRALAVIDAISSEGVRQNNVDRFVTLGLQARLTLGLSGALRKRDVGVGDLDARQALVLGWVRTLAAAYDPSILSRNSRSLDGAGAIQLLERAAQAAPDDQAARVALALAKASVDHDDQQACDLAIGLQTAARTGGSAAIRLAAAERVVQLATTMQGQCHPSRTSPYKNPVQLPPPQPETGYAPPADTGNDVSGRRRGPGNHTIPFVMIAPFFKGYMDDAAVLRIAQRARLDEYGLEDVLKRDTVGDITLAVINASVLIQRISADDNADVAWLAVLRRHGLTDRGTAVRATLAVSQLTGVEALCLAYAYALAGRSLTSDNTDAAQTAAPQQLFARARQMLPANAVLGPVMALAHVIDLERMSGLCQAAGKVDALRFAINKATLPEAARTPLLEALATVDGQCRDARGAAR